MYYKYGHVCKNATCSVMSLISALDVCIDGKEMNECLSRNDLSDKTVKSNYWLALQTHVGLPTIVLNLHIYLAC